jgi:phosphinothricin acetyltransferase
MSQMSKDPCLLVRDADDSDLPAIQNIYAFYVRHSLATFEEIPPSLDDLLLRRHAILDAHLPYLIATLGQKVVGYAYAAFYRPRPAYRFTVEDSIYVADTYRSQGIGSALLSAVIERCEQGDWRQMIAVIGDSGNKGSIALHRRFGFKPIGNLKAVGFKLGQWVDTVLMQRGLGNGDGTLPS